MAAVRGIHYFESFWQPKENELLCCHFKIRNFYDIFAVITCNEKGRMGSPDHRSRSKSYSQTDRRTLLQISTC